MDVLQVTLTSCWTPDTVSTILTLGMVLSLPAKVGDAADTSNTRETLESRLEPWIADTRISFAIDPVLPTKQEGPPRVTVVEL